MSATNEPSTKPIVLHAPPQNEDELHDWIANATTYRIARRPIIPGHAAPFDYICHAFFEGDPPAKRTDGRPRAPRAPDCTVWAARGSGKTFLGALATLLDLIFKPGIQVRILGGSLEQSQRMHAHLRALLSIDGFKKLDPRISARRVCLTVDGKISMAEVLAASQTSVRGTRVQKLRCDEVDLFDPEVWDAAQLVTRSMALTGPCGNVVRGSVEALSTMHRPFGLMWKLAGDATAPPPSPDQDAPAASRTLFRWGIVDVLERCTDARSCAGCPLADDCAGRAKQVPTNHAGHVAIDDATAMKARVGRETWDSEMLCLRPSRSASVYPEFDLARHVIGDEALPSAGFARFIAGMDFGVRSESVVLLAGLDADDNITVLREHVRKGLPVADHAKAINSWIESGLCDTQDGRRLEWIGIDPAGAAREVTSASSPKKVLTDHGLTCRHRTSRISHGVRLVRARFAPAWDGRTSGTPTRPRLLIHRACTRLIECLAKYHYDENKPEDLIPVKTDEDHACDALRYLVLNLDTPGKVECESYEG